MKALASLVVFAAFALAAFALPAHSLLGAAILPSLPPGSQYQIVFVTSDFITGTAGTEAPYNALVNTDAASLNALLASAGIHGVTWSAITSTIDGTRASSNAPSTGTRVYDTGAQLINTPGNSLYGSALLNNGILRDQDGTLPSVGNYIWTGTPLQFGPAVPPLGSFPVAESGFSGNINSNWLSAQTLSVTFAHQLYGLSSVITVPVPEPSTILLLGLGVAGIALKMRRRFGRAMRCGRRHS